jgi:hypothetical protein
MNGKDRVQAAIARRPVDRVPLGFYAVDYDTVQHVLGHETYVRNKIAQQLALWEGRRAEVADSVKRDTVELFRKLDCADIILPKEAPLLPPKDYTPDPPRRTGPDTWEDRQGRVYKAAWDANEIACVHDPSIGTRAYTVDDFAGHALATPPDPSVFEAVDYVYELLGADRYVASPSGGFSPMLLLDGIERGLLMYGLEPEVVAAATSQAAAQQNALDQWYIRPGAPGVLMEQDFAGSNGPMISPRMFVEMCFAPMKERISSAKRFAPQVIFHSCGNNIPLIPTYCDAGIDCYQSLQTTAGMEVGRLKQMFGDRLCFWGGVPVEDLIAGTPDDVRQDVRLAMERGGPGGGFILGPSHSIAKNTKYENFMAMLDEYDKLCYKYA